MLQEPVVLTTAKLDISLLLKPTPSPSPSTPSSTPRETARGTHSEEYMLLARSSSVPALSVQQHALEGSHRGSTSSTISAAITSNIVPTAQASGFATVLPTGRDPMEVQAPSHHRPILPPLLTSNPSPYQRRPPQHYASQPRFSSPQQQPLVPINFNPPTKRPRPNSPPTQPAPAKRQSKWTPEEDAIIIELRGTGMKWDDISKRLPGRSAISCRLHYQNYLERRSEWDEEKKNRLARLYER
ncbi:MAG: hypothetical protein LQ340_005994 [Diploschistes diacapsis]|nr:MAG: hypothetical protein LQ340_005994 [Diploschistes diacapsis]